MNSRQLKTLLGIFIVLILGFAGYWAARGNRRERVSNETNNSQISIPTDWKVYKNPSGYEISYPSSWFATDDTASAGTALSEYSISPKPSGYYDPVQLLQIVVDKGTLEAELNKKADKDKAQKVILNGYSALKLPLDAATTIYLLEKDGKVFQINYSYDENLGITKNEADEVLATFKLQ